MSYCHRAIVLASLIALAGCAESSSTSRPAASQPPQVKGVQPAKPAAKPDARGQTTSRPSTTTPTKPGAAPTKTTDPKQQTTAQRKTETQAKPAVKPPTQPAAKPAAAAPSQASTQKNTQADRSSNARSEPLPPKERAKAKPPAAQPQPPQADPPSQRAMQEPEPAPQPQQQAIAPAQAPSIPPVSGRPIEEGLAQPARRVPPVAPISGRPTEDGSVAASSSIASPVSTPQTSAITPDPSLPAYAVVAKAQNDRSQRLQRVWARAVASITFVDNDGKQRWEQGEGHFQVIQPSKMALSVGKLGEVFLWLGCDEDRYWFIDPKETKRAYVGRHDLVTRKKVESLGLPVAPRDLIALSGVTPVPQTLGADSTLGRGSAGEYVLEQPRPGALWRTKLDQRLLTPIGIDIFDAGGRQIITSELEGYAEVRLRGEAGNFPTMPSRMKLTHLPTSSSMSLSLSDATDGGRGRLSSEVFNFESLVERLGITEVVDLDEGD